MTDPYTIYVRWRGNDEYHRTNWASETLDKTMGNVKDIMEVVEMTTDPNQKLSEHKGLKRFTGVKIYEKEVEIYKEEQE